MCVIAELPQFDPNVAEGLTGGAELMTGLPDYLGLRHTEVGPLNDLAPVTEGTLDATARIALLTKRTAVVRIEVVNESRVVCMAQGTVLIMAPKSG